MFAVRELQKADITQEWHNSPQTGDHLEISLLTPRCAVLCRMMKSIPTLRLYLRSGEMTAAGALLLGRLTLRMSVFSMSVSDSKKRSSGFKEDDEIGSSRTATVDEIVERVWATALANISDDRPGVTFTDAQGVDGSIRTVLGARTAISADEFAAVACRLRVSHSAIMVGGDPVRIDDPLVTVQAVERFGPRPVVTRLPATAGSDLLIYGTFRWGR